MGMYNSNETARAILKALRRAFQDPKRQHLRSEGMDERDLAFEADLIIPSDMELPRYASIKRGPIIRILEQMENQGLIEFNDPRPGTLYRVLPTRKGEELAESLSRPWYKGLLALLTRRAK